MKFNADPLSMKYTISTSMNIEPSPAAADGGDVKGTDVVGAIVNGNIAVGASVGEFVGVTGTLTGACTVGEAVSPADVGAGVPSGATVGVDVVVGGVGGVGVTVAGTSVDGTVGALATLGATEGLSTGKIGGRISSPEAVGTGVARVGFEVGLGVGGGLKADCDDELLLLLLFIVLLEPFELLEAIVLNDIVDIDDFDDFRCRRNTRGGARPLILADTILTSSSKIAVISHRMATGFVIVVELSPSRLASNTVVLARQRRRLVDLG